MGRAGVRGLAAILGVCGTGWGASSLAGNFDGDGDVDLADHAVLCTCLGGSGATPDPPSPVTSYQCLQTFDADHDGDVDVRDFGVFAAAYTGSLPTDCNSNGILDRDDLDSRFSFDCNTNGIPDECDIAAGTSQDCDDNRVPDTCIEYGLAVESVTELQANGAVGFVVTTTGGVFGIMPTHILVRRRISLETNEAEPDPPILARITFDGAGIGTLAKECETRQSCRIASSSGLVIDVRADSLVSLTCASSGGYTYESLLGDPTWVACRYVYDYGNKMWARLGEGTIHLTVPDIGGVTALAGADPTNQIHVDLSAGGQTAFAVFPSKPRDLQYLYGTGARPHTVFIYSASAIPTDPLDFEDMAENGFGSMVLFEGLYHDLDGDGTAAPDVINTNGLIGYVFQQPQAILDLVEQAHAHGFKVITYMQPAGFQPQPVETTLDWMRQFQNAFGLDGWYFDGASAATGGWPPNYDFIRATRRQVGDEGLIYHHCSYDEWGGGGGNVAFAPYEAWESYTLRGEWEGHSQVTGPNDPFLADMCGSHGGLWPLHKVRSRGADLLTAESTRLFQQNLWGAYRCSVTSRQDWPKYGRPHWRARQEEYAAASGFSTTLAWPPDWYQELRNVTWDTTPTSITVHFQTGEANSYGEIRVVKNLSSGYHFDYVAQSGQILLKRYSCTQGREHHISVEGLTADTPYRILVRAYVGEVGAPCAQAVDRTMLEDVHGTAIVVRTSADCNGNGIGDDQDIAAGTSLDCNTNGVPDECDLTSGGSPDCNGNGRPDECDIAAGTSLDCNTNDLPDECEPDCNTNGTPDSCDISAGTSADCNGNGRPDDCDIADGTSADCTTNGLPDECEPDCNSNGTADSCDISAGTSSDCNGNGLPDECDLATAQWAATLLAVTSEWGHSSPPPPEGCSGAQVLGPPDVPYHESHVNAWACLEDDEGLQRITVGFAVPVYANGLTVVESYNVGFVKQIRLLDEFQGIQSIWSGTDPSAGSEIVHFQVGWDRTPYRVVGVEVTIDTEHVQRDWEETDAIRLHGALSLDLNTNGVPDECE